MTNVLDLLNTGFTPGAAGMPTVPVSSLSAVPNFAAGATGFGAGTVPRISGGSMSLESVMPFVAQILGMKHPNYPTFGGDIVQRPGQAINTALAARNPGYAALFSQPTYYG